MPTLPARKLFLAPVVGRSVMASWRKPSSPLPRSSRLSPLVSSPGSSRPLPLVSSGLINLTVSDRSKSLAAAVFEEEPLARVDAEVDQPGETKVGFQLRIARQINPGRPMSKPRSVTELKMS